MPCGPGLVSSHGVQPCLTRGGLFTRRPACPNAISTKLRTHGRASRQPARRWPPYYEQRIGCSETSTMPRAMCLGQLCVKRRASSQFSAFSIPQFVHCFPIGICAAPRNRAFGNQRQLTWEESSANHQVADFGTQLSWRSNSLDSYVFHHMSCFSMRAAPDKHPPLGQVQVAGRTSRAHLEAAPKGLCLGCHWPTCGRLITLGMWHRSWTVY